MRSRMPPYAEVPAGTARCKGRHGHRRQARRLQAPFDDIGVATMLVASAPTHAETAFTASRGGEAGPPPPLRRRSVRHDWTDCRPQNDKKRQAKENHRYFGVVEAPVRTVYYSILILL